MDQWVILGDIIVLLAACIFTGGFFSRLGQSPLVGYLLAGMILGGPGSIHAVKSVHEIEAIAELGVALLLFGLGLEFSFKRLRKLGFKPLVGGILQVILTILLVFVGAWFTGLSARVSLAFGSLVALSSTAIVLRMLMERGEMEMPHARNSLAVLLVQDIAVIPLALLITMLGKEGELSEISFEILKLLLMLGCLIIGMALLNRVAVLFLGTLTLHRNRELTVLFAVVAGLGAAWASHFAGISPSLGAFIAGMLLGNSVFATQIRADISPLRVVLLTLFFGSAGMLANPVWIMENWFLVTVITLALTAGKLFVIWIIFQSLGQSPRISAATGLCLAQVGEFAFVLGSIGKANGVITEEMFALVISITIVSFLLSAFLVPSAPRFGNLIAKFGRRKHLPLEEEEKAEREPQFVIVGFGPSGQIASRRLVDKKYSVLVIDLNHQGIQKAEQSGFHGLVGDATQSEVLEHLSLKKCKAAIITIPHYQSSIIILEHLKKLAPHIRLFVRARHQIHFDDFLTQGAHYVVGDEEEVGLKLSKLLEEIT